MTEPVIVIHGGAWSVPNSLVDSTKTSIKRCALEGYAVLREGGSAVDAVQAAVMALENDDLFNAGKGSVLNAEGEIEMDALIMDGKNLRAGAVGCVQNIANPIVLARMVMDKTAHTMIIGKGANSFADKMGIPKVDTNDLITELSKFKLSNLPEYGKAVKKNFRKRDTMSRIYVEAERPLTTANGHDTVGAVALDRYGNVASATSTGGITAKMPGRIGDSPIIGSGGYADNRVGAVSTTGHGESISKVCLSRHINWLMQTGMAPQQAAEAGLAYMAKRVDGFGGAIVVDAAGDIGRHCTTQRMSWAAVKAGRVQYGINTKDHEIEEECLPAAHLNTINESSY